MTKRNKNGILLLVTYLLVVLFSNNGIQQYDSANFQRPAHFHTHDTYEGVHHEHKFHIGIFHYLGHIYESIVSADFDSSDHFSFTKTEAKVDIKYNSSTFHNIYSWVTTNIVREVNLLAMPPPVDWLIPNNSHCPFLTLRAPPAHSTFL